MRYRRNYKAGEDAYLSFDLLARDKKRNERLNQFQKRDFSSSIKVGQGRFIFDFRPKVSLKILR